MLATLPVACAPDSALQVTSAVWSTLSLVASDSAKPADTWSWVRSDNWMNPLDDELFDDDDEDDDVDDEPLPLLALPPAVLPVPVPALPDPADVPVPDVAEVPELEELPTEPLTAVTVPAIGAVNTLPSTAPRSASTVAWAEETCAVAAEIVAVAEVESAWATLSPSLAACRLACAVFSVSRAAVGSTLASS